MPLDSSALNVPNAKRSLVVGQQTTQAFPLTAGALYRDAQKRLWLILSKSGPDAAVAPVIISRDTTWAGDVEIGRAMVVRTALVRLWRPEGLPVGQIPPEALAPAIRAAERCAVQARQMARYAPCRSRQKLDAIDGPRSQDRRAAEGHS